VRRLPAPLRFTAIFALSIAAGVAAYLGLGRHTEPRSAAAPRATAPPLTRDANDAAPPVARLEPSPASARPASAVTPQSVAREPNAADVATAQPDVPPARDRLSRKTVRALVERVFKGKLADRELTPRDYDRLVDAVMRLRSALRSLRRDDESPAASAAVLDEHRQAVRSALGDIEVITGVPPSQLGDVLVSEDDLTATPNDGAESAAPDGSR
jgi:hypothetical protein